MKSSLLLMEQLIAILIFAICAAVCVRIFTASYVISGDGRDLNNALVIAKSGAECFKAASGDTEKTARFLGGVYNADGVLAYYDKERLSCGKSGAAYIMSITQKGINENNGELVFGNVLILRNDGKELLKFEVAARREPE